MSDLISMYDANQANRAAWIEENKLQKSPRPNGIACPKCQKEMRDQEPHKEVIGPGSPFPHLTVVCPACDFKSYRIKPVKYSKECPQPPIVKAEVAENKAQ